MKDRERNRHRHERDRRRERGPEPSRETTRLRERPAPSFDRAREQPIVYGIEPVHELLAASPSMVRVLHVRSGDERRFADEIAKARAANARVASIDEAALDSLCGPDARHQGIAAEIGEYAYGEFEEILADKPDPLLVIDGVTDPRNLGAIIRSAEGAGASAMVIARDRTVGLTPVAIKASAGAWIHMKIARCGNVARALEDLKEEGYWIAALAPGGDTSIYELDTTRRLAIVIGAEGKGVRDIVRKGSDFIVDIPMRGKVASLNVSVATAVALYEVMRRRDVASM